MNENEAIKRLNDMFSRSVVSGKFAIDVAELLGVDADDLGLVPGEMEADVVYEEEDKNLDSIGVGRLMYRLVKYGTDEEAETSDMIGSGKREQELFDKNFPKVVREMGGEYITECGSCGNTSDNVDDVYPCNNCDAWAKRIEVRTPEEVQGA